MCEKNATFQASNKEPNDTTLTQSGRTRQDFEWCEMLVRGYLGRLSLVAYDEGLIGEFLPLEDWLAIAIENGLKASYDSYDPEIFAEHVFDVLTECETDRIQIGEHFFQALPVGEDDILFGFVHVDDLSDHRDKASNPVIQHGNSEEGNGYESGEEAEDDHN